MGRLAAALDRGEFVVTAEIGPPKSADAEAVRRKARLLAGVVDAANVTDNQTAVVRMSPLAAAVLMLAEGLEPVMQVVCRDRNRMAITSDLLGASALGVPNVMCMTGDPVAMGNFPGARPVFDLDGLGLIALAAELTLGRFGNGEEFAPRASFLVGGAESPADDSSGGARLKAKADAGARFVQTQPVYDVAGLLPWLRRVEDLGLLERVAVIVGVTPPKSLTMARNLAANVPGVDVPPDVLRRLEGASDPQAEGVALAAEIVAELRVTPGVAGAHIMAIAQEDVVPDVVRAAGLPARQPG